MLKPKKDKEEHKPEPEWHDEPPPAPAPTLSTCPVDGYQCAPGPCPVCGNEVK